MVEKKNNNDIDGQEETRRAEREAIGEATAQTLIAIIIFSSRETPNIDEEMKSKILATRSRLFDGGGEAIRTPAIEELRAIEHERSNAHDTTTVAMLEWTSHPTHPSGQFRSILNARPDIKEKIDAGDIGAIEEVSKYIDIDLVPETEALSPQLRAVLNARPDLKERIARGDSSAAEEANSFVSSG